MAAATPTLAQFLDAIHARLVALQAAGQALEGHTVQKYEHRFENEYLEVVEAVQNSTTGEANIWILDVEAVDEDEPSDGAVGEIYEVYRARIRYLSVRANVANWSELARDKAEAVRNDLSKNTSVFRIGSQPQLRTPETVQFSSHEKIDRNGQTYFESTLRPVGEGRRF